jgi:hypothetical protein
MGSTSIALLAVAQIGGSARLRLRPVLVAHREMLDRTARSRTADYAPVLGS